MKVYPEKDARSNHGEHMMVCFARIMFILLFIVTVLNGSVFWLKRVGLVDQEHYAYTQSYMTSFDPASDPPTAEEVARVNALIDKFYQTDRGEFVFKLLKEIWIALFISLSVLFVFKYGRENNFLLSGPLLLLMAPLLMSLSLSAIRLGPLYALAGARYFSFLFIICLGAWAAGSRQLNVFAKGVLLFLLLQLYLIPYEFANGLRMFGARFFGQDYGDRVVGTMLQPSSLGLMAVLGLAFYIRFAKHDRSLISMLIISAILVFFSASAMALMLLFLLLLFELHKRTDLQFSTRIRVGGMVGVFLLILILPTLSGRWDIMDSLWGRLLLMITFLDGLSLKEFIFGQGMGVGTNSILSLAALYPAAMSSGDINGLSFISDSTPVALIAQVGLVGLMLFYGLLAYAANRDPESALFYILVSIGSATTNLSELFPVNIMLGLVLAHSLLLSRRMRP